MSTAPDNSTERAAAQFADRHIGPRDSDRATMLAALGFDSLSALMDAAVPGGISMGLLSASEFDRLEELARDEWPGR